MKKSWYSLKALAANTVALSISDEIGAFGISAGQFVQELNQLGAVDEIRVFLNSPGGSVQDGVAIFNALKTNPAKVIIEINGWALSIASFIAMAGDVVTITSNSLIMVHNPWTTTTGSADELRKMAEVLDKTRDTLIGGYSRSGKTRDEIVALLDAETWYDADEALVAGFVDEIITTDGPVVAGFNTNFIIPTRFKPKGNSVPTPITDANRSEILNADRTRRATISANFDRFRDHEGMSEVMAACLDDVNCSEEQANKKLLAHLGSQSSPVNAHGRFSSGNEIVLTHSENRTQDFMEACSHSLLIRSGVRVNNPSPMVRDVERMNITAMAESVLSMNGKRFTGLGRADIIKAALTTSDFPQLLSGTVGKAMMQGYENEPATHSIWTGEKEVADFKPQSLTALSEAPGLLEVAEGGEYKNGIFGEAGEKFSIKTFGRILEITRQALINDDLQAFTQMPAAFGSSARRKEADMVYEKLTGNSLLSDGKPLFHSAHGNLAAAGNNLTAGALGAARAAMRRQKGPQGLGYIDPQPRFLIVPVALESQAELIINSLVLPDATNDTNNLQWVRNLTIVADPRLDDVSEIAWYLAASPQQLDTIVRAYLSGEPRPFYEEQQEFKRDVLGVKCRLDFGVGIVDYRGLYKNPGL